ncbi:MAG: PVC-type heme-binding CxxCH protein, partial [Verrucomicrobiota bacterium]
DGDGRADKSTLFAGGLSYATSVTPWRGGVLVAAPPEVVWLKDTNGDGVADVREVVIRGFRRGVSDSLVNGLQYGLDNRIHGANGGNGGRLTVPGRPDEALDLGDDDFAWDPQAGRVARTGESGGGFGLVFDDWGRAFTTYNIDHFQHRFLTREQAGRHPGFPAVDLTGSISDHEEMSRIYPVSVAQTRPNHPEQAGRFSAAGGMGRVASAAWPEDLRGSVFVADVVGNLVHRDVVVADGPVFRATRAPGEQTREFLASRDPAFRPVGLETGPDGALYLLDMQREVIEHPDYIPAKVREKLDVRSGERRGRIYRLTPKGGLRAVRPGLAAKPDAELVPLLGHADAWWRLTAQRLLVERRATGQVESLRRWRREAPPVGRLHALWTLEGLGLLSAGDLEGALGDAHPGVRENALTLFEGRAGAFTGLAEKVRRLAADPDARVRFRAALAMGTLPDAASASALAELLGREAADRWMRRAVWASLAPEHQRAAGRWLAGGDLDARVRAELVAEYAELVGARAGQRPGDVSWCLAQLAPGMVPEVRRRGL